MADDTKPVENIEEPTSIASPAENEGITESEVTVTSETDHVEAPEQSERAKSRQHELAQKLKVAEDALLKKLAQYEPEAPPVAPYTSPLVPKPTSPNYSGVRELSQQEYEQEVASKANELVDLRVGQIEQKLARREKRSTDIDYLESKYPELKPGVSQNKMLTKKVIKLYQQASASNPDLSLASFVDEVMTLREAGQVEGREEATAQITKNESEAVLTPTPSKSKRFSTEEELTRALAEGKISAKEAREFLLPKE